LLAIGYQLSAISWRLLAVGLLVGVSVAHGWFWLLTDSR
jgi:hypothetical protein